MTAADRRRRFAALAAIAVALAALLAYAAWPRPRDLSAEDRQLVGTWRQTADNWGGAKMSVGDFELRGDRTLHMTTTDRATGDTTHVENAGKWRLDGDVIVLHGGTRRDEWFWHRWIRAAGSSFASDDTGLRIDSTDGVEMRLTTVHWYASGKVMPQPLQTCTWQRVDGK